MKPNISYLIPLTGENFQGLFAALKARLREEGGFCDPPPRSLERCLLVEHGLAALLLETDVGVENDALTSFTLFSSEVAAEASTPSYLSESRGKTSTNVS